MDLTIDFRDGAALGASRNDMHEPHVLLGSKSRREPWSQRRDVRRKVIPLTLRQFIFPQFSPSFSKAKRKGYRGGPPSLCNNVAMFFILL